MVCLGNQVNTARAQSSMKFQIGVGAAASEQVLATLYAMTQNGTTSAGNIHPRLFAFPCDIPEGSRIAARSMCSVTDATDRLADIVVIGVS